MHLRRDDRFTSFDVPVVVVVVVVVPVVEAVAS
jgi:hypothetical protein